MRKLWRFFAAAILAGLLAAAGCAIAEPAAPVAAPQGEPSAGEVRLSASGIAAAWIPAGTFTMGSSEAEVGRGLWEGPLRQVTIYAGFWMGVHPVTQEQWARVMGSNPSHFSAGQAYERRPVEQVSWYAILVFANRLSIMEGLSPAYIIGGSGDPDDWGEVPESENALWDAVQIAAGSTGWRLPTEAQWEHAARAGTEAAFSDGTCDWQNEEELGLIGWFDFNSGGTTHEAGLKKPNPWGLYDIHGNVWELVWDWLADPADPAGALAGVNRVLRGGSWSSPAQYARSASRSGTAPFESRGINVGLRLVRP